MVMLIGRAYTRFSNQFLSADKAYRALVHLGETRDTFDVDGKILSSSGRIPTTGDVETALEKFQGDCQQIPPMFSAKKIRGRKLYELARKGKTIERSPISIHLATTLIRYEYPEIELDITCSKGTYIRSLAQDLGEMLQCGAYLKALSRTRSGSFSLADCASQESLSDPSSAWTTFLRKTI
jgi:tRNA pseudouridine55 synthase